jgi:hypothetical protein
MCPEVQFKNAKSIRSENNSALRHSKKKNRLEVRSRPSYRRKTNGRSSRTSRERAAKEENMSGGKHNKNEF